MKGDVNWQRNNWMYIFVDSKYKKNNLQAKKRARRGIRRKAPATRSQRKAVHHPVYVTGFLFFKKFILLDSPLQTFGTEMSVVSPRSITFLQATFLSLLLPSLPLPLLRIISDGSYFITKFCSQAIKMQQHVTISSGVHMQLYLPLNPQEYKVRHCQARAETRCSQKS